MTILAFTVPIRPLIRKLSAASRRQRIVSSRDGASGGMLAQERPVRVMIVEDDYLIGSQMAQALTDAGFEIVGVERSFEGALDRAEKSRPALVVMDIRLTGARNGIEAAHELFTKLGIRCVFATAHQGAEVRERAKTAKPLGWLSKPFTMVALVEVAREAVQYL